MASRTVTLTGWGRVAPSSAELAEPAIRESAPGAELRPPSAA